MSTDWEDWESHVRDRKQAKISNPIAQLQQGVSAASNTTSQLKTEQENKPAQVHAMVLNWMNTHSAEPTDTAEVEAGAHKSHSGEGMGPPSLLFRDNTLSSEDALKPADIPSVDKPNDRSSPLNDERIQLDENDSDDSDSDGDDDEDPDSSEDDSTQENLAVWRVSGVDLSPYGGISTPGYSATGSSSGNTSGVGSTPSSSSNATSSIGCPTPISSYDSNLPNVNVVASSRNGSARQKPGAQPMICWHSANGVHCCKGQLGRNADVRRLFMYVSSALFFARMLIR